MGLGGGGGGSSSSWYPLKSAILHCVPCNDKRFSCCFGPDADIKCAFHLSNTAIKINKKSAAS